MRVVIFLCAWSLAAPTFADVYRWVDSEGKTHYGDRAPRDGGDKAARVSIKTAPATIDADAEKARQQMRVIDEGRQRERAFAEQKAVQEQQRKEEMARRCKSLQSEMRDDQNVAVFYRYDDAGKRVLWTSEERLAYREKLNNLNQTYCSGSSG